MSMRVWTGERAYRIIRPFTGGERHNALREEGTIFNTQTAELNVIESAVDIVNSFFDAHDYGTDERAMCYSD